MSALLSYCDGPWLTCTDAISGNDLTFNVRHIAVIREGRNTTYIVLSNALEYEIEESYSTVLSSIGLTTPVAAAEKEAQ